MKKILSVALSTAMAFSMFASVAFGETATTPQAKFDALAAKGILNGYPDGKAHLENDLTRAEFAKIVAKLFNLKEETGKLSYKDKGYNAKNWAVPYIEAVTTAKLMQGKDTVKGLFDYNGKVTVQEVATVLARALKLETPSTTDNNASTWAKGYAQAVINKGLIAASTSFQSNATRSLVVEAAYEVSVLSALPTVVSAQALTPTTVLVTFSDKTTTTVTLTEALVAGVEKTISFTYNGHDYTAKVTLASAQVLSVTPINATQVEVKFNRALDKTDAETASLYTINGVTPASVELSADETTVTLTFTNASEVEVTNGVVVVNPVLLKDSDTKTAKFTTVLTFEDTTAPVIASVYAKTNTTVASTVVVTASEPIVSSLAKVDGSYYTIAWSGKTGKITGVSLASNANHTVELINLLDKGGNKTVSTSQSFAVTVDTVAPTATLSAQSDKGILVTFSKEMDPATVINAFSVKDELLGNVNFTAPTAAVANTNNTQFLLQVTDTLYSTKTSRTLSVVIPGTVKDYLGNAYVAGSQSVALTKDTVKPAATSYKLVKNSDGKVTSIEVNFSEGLAAGTPALPTIVNSNGVAISASSFLGGLTPSAVTAGAKKVVYTVGAPDKLTGVYAFSFASGLVKDRAETPNSSDAFNYTIDFGAGSTTFKLTSANAVGNVVTVEFGRPVKGGAVANSATDLANYSLAGKPLPAGTSITLDSVQDTATITLPADSVEKTDSAAIFTVANVAALSGELLTTYSDTLSVTDNTKPVLNYAALTSDNKLAIGFNETLNVAPVIGDLVVKVNGEVVNTAGLTVTAGSGSDAGKYLIDLSGFIEQAATATSATYFDLNNNGVLDSSDITLATGPITSPKLSTLAAISTVTVTTKTSGTTVAEDAAHNSLKNDVTVSAK